MRLLDPYDWDALPQTGFPAVSALFALPAPLLTGLPLVMVAAIVALVAWALQLMQAANDRREFSLMLAGCMVCSAAVGLATVMVLTFTSPLSFESRWSLIQEPGYSAASNVDGSPAEAASNDLRAMPWEVTWSAGATPARISF